MSQVNLEISEIPKPMTLRDYFAAKAMQAFINPKRDVDFEYVAKRAYEYADAMLKARGE